MLSFDRMLLGWARKQPADRAYDYSAVDDCALCHFLRDTGMAQEPRVGGTMWRDRAVGFEYRQLGRVVSDAVAQDPHTYGALADRLANALGKEA